MSAPLAPPHTFPDPGPAPKNPSGHARPDFGGPVFSDMVKEACPAVAGGRAERTPDEVIQELEKRWDAQHHADMAAWEAWCTAKEEYDAAEGAAEAQAVETAAQKTRAEKHAEAPEPGTDATVATEAPLVVHPYAAKRVTANKYVPLDYWCKAAILRAGANARVRSSGTEDAQEILPGVRISVADVAPDSKIRDDAVLALDEMSYGSAGWLEAMKAADHPDWMINGFATMWMRLVNHREFRAHEILGDRIIIVYAAEVRLQFYELLERKQPSFRPENISDDKLRGIERRLMREFDIRGQSFLPRV
jgi:hypothetical protein